MTEPTATTESIAEEAGRLLAATTDGPWQVIEDCYEDDGGKSGKLIGQVAQRRIATTWHHPQLKGPVGVVNGYVTIGRVCGQSPHTGIKIEKGDAEFIAASPRLVRELLSALRAAEARGKVQGLREAERAVVETCPACEGQGQIISVGTGDGHGCDGTERSCWETCPVPVPVEIAELCEFCQRPAAAIRELIAALEQETTP